MRSNALVEQWRLRFDSLLVNSLSQRWSHFDPLWRHRLLYPLKSGGKRIRALMVYGIGHAYGLDISLMDDIACAVELVHTYSLIHDDLPAMDDDDFRRGCLSAHRAFNEADAILMGDALLTDAFHLLSLSRNICPEYRLSLIRELSFASGSFQLVYGQWIDLSKNIQSFEQLCDLHRKKTGAIFSFCMIAGGIVSGHNHHRDILSKIGSDIGLSFQLQDDLLDNLPMHETGKSQGKDQKQGKKTTLAFLENEQAWRLCDQLYDDSLDMLKEICPNPVALIDLITTLRCRINKNKAV